MTLTKCLAGNLETGELDGILSEDTLRCTGAVLNGKCIVHLLK